MNYLIGTCSTNAKQFFYECSNVSKINKLDDNKILSDTNKFNVQ